MKRISLKDDGTILLGDNISCDGFACDRGVRVQTHIHSDHMVDFNTSKANQQIVMSHETRDLLCAIMNADLPYRDNILGLAFGTPTRIGNEEVTLHRSHHMLGGAQVQVGCADGYRVGYSSDFFWPVETVIQVDELIVDATYGSPDSRRLYSAETVDAKLSDAVNKSLRSGRQAAIIGHTGRLQAAMALLMQLTSVPIICSPKAFKPLETYRANGYALRHAIPSDDSEAQNLLRERAPCLAFVTFHEKRHMPWVDRMAKVTLSASHTAVHDPVIDYGNGDYCVAYTDHADFDGTVEYVKATGAQIVWTDPRTGDAEGLAHQLTKLLGICAKPAERIHSNAWG